MDDSVNVSITPYVGKEEYDFNRIIYDIDSQIEILSSKADNIDYLVSIASGLLCGVLDVFWVGEFSLEQGRTIASEKVDGFVTSVAKKFGYKGDDIQGAVKFLQDKFPIPADGNTPDFGGGLQHHLRDFAHHPTLLGLFFSLLTQFTYKSYGTDVNGNFLIVDVPERSLKFIGEDVPTKILYGTVVWFFHLVSDMAGTDKTAGKSGGTGIPGPILALLKELSALPLFKNIKVGDNSLSAFLSKLFNGTLLAKRDENGKITKDGILRMDLRGELGVGIELCKQAIPVIANDCIVRIFYFIRRFAIEVKEKDIRSIADLEHLSWESVMPTNNPTIARMLTIATGVFTTVDVGEAIVSQKYLVSVNYIGVGRFAVAIGEDVAWCLRARPLKKLKQMYEDMKRFAYSEEDDRIYDRLGRNFMETDKFGLTMEQTEILYNIEYYKTLNDIVRTKLPIGEDEKKSLKMEWLEEWKGYMSDGFSSFLQVEGAVLHWYSEEELLRKIRENAPNEVWYRLVLLEAMLFEPYYAISLETDKKGNEVPSKKYASLQGALAFGGYNRNEGDAFIQITYATKYCSIGYIKRLRKCYDRVMRELTEVLKTTIISIASAALIAIATTAAAGVLAPTIAVALVGSNFAGLYGAALTSACLAYLGGGAIAAGGLGMAGGTMVIVGGGAALGLGLGAGVGGAVGAAGILGKRNAIFQSAKLLVSVREIFLNDEKDINYSEDILEMFGDKICALENKKSELRIKLLRVTPKDEKELEAEIKELEDTIKAMERAFKSMNKFISSFSTGLN